jgi:peptidoglycan/xylan/chitin deacetylase (PgdA/CDA1 family)
MLKLRQLAQVLGKTGLRSILAACLPPKGILGLNYHRIGDGSRSNLDRDLWSASADAFDQQIAFLKLHCDVIAPSDIDAARANPRGRHVLVTFDDGYLDNYEQAFPILRRHNVPATFFIATGFVDDPRLPWWDEIAAIVRASADDAIDLGEWLPKPLAIDRDHPEVAIRTLLNQYKVLPSTQAEDFLARLRSVAKHGAPASRESLWMNWDMLREMSSHGMTIGGHTVNHAVLSRMPKEHQRKEIAGCAARIEKEVGRRMDYFAYPVGGRDSFNADTQACLRELGVRYAFSYYGGFARAGADPLDMPRSAIEPYIDRDWFRAIAQLPQLFCRINESSLA